MLEGFSRKRPRRIVVRELAHPKRAVEALSSRSADLGGVISKLPAVRYAKSSNGWVAYGVIGDGPADLILLPGPISHLDLLWDEPSCAWFLRVLARFSRLIIFDRSGTGLSDPVGTPVPEQTIDDFKAVANACNARRPTLFGISGGGGLAALIAATLPERAARLILYSSYAKLSWDPDSHDYLSRGHHQQNPTVVDDPRVVAWSERFFRSAGSPTVIRDIVSMMSRLDVRPLLDRIVVPTLVMGRKNDSVVSIENSRYLAAHIPRAQLLEMSGVDHHPWFGNAAEVLDAVESFVVGQSAGGRRRRTSLRAALTRREQEIIALLSADLTADQIGKRLVISPRTVETHVAHVYAKLGVSSRMELNRLVLASAGDVAADAEPDSFGSPVPPVD